MTTLTPTFRGIALWLAALAAMVPVTAQTNRSRPVAGSDYVIGVEDVLRVVVWDEPELKLTLKVRPDGMITLPLINDVLAAGRTPAQLRETITQELTAFIRNPNVAVIVEEINSFKVYVLGEVSIQGVLTFTKPTRLLQALATAGGLTEFSGKEVVVVRQKGEQEMRISVSLKRVYSGSSFDDDMYLEPDDILVFR
ncbi:MAG: polysaccharide export protein [Acidobacteriota bacterium]|nr:polysaccharide export protein [Acidobacteriota bacterium]